MQSKSKQSNNTEQSAFRRIEKKYKKYKNQTTDFTDVIDLRELDKNTVKNRELIIPVENTYKKRIFKIKSIDGLVFIENAFSVEDQLDLAEKALRVYPRSTSSVPNQTNLDPFHGHVDVPSLIDTVYNLKENEAQNLNPRSEGQEPPMKKQKISHDNQGDCDLVDADNNSVLVTGENTSENRQIQNTNEANSQHFTKEFLHQLRWITLGYHYNWTKRIYQKEHHSPFPSDLFRLNQQIATWAETRIIPEAAIVNYYHLDSFLCGHLDDVEFDFGSPVISISLGHSAVFLIGGKTKDIEPVALFVRSGDVVIMGGESRLFMHGVPRIIDHSLPKELVDAASTVSQRAVIAYLNDSRININVRDPAMFKKNLTDLITGIRSHKANEGQYISQCIQEIKEELKSDSKSVKTIAVQKLTYLQMLGYDMKWAAFNVVEVMSFQSFTNKRIAYSAASQSFDENTDVTMLTTNLIKKDFMGKSLYEAGMALTCLGNICTPDLARDLAPDVVSMLTSSRPYIRKKAVLVLYKIFLKFPDALRPSFNRLKDKLEDPDPAVVSAAVNVFCELAKSNPKNYLVLAPTLYKLLSKSSNNWMLIKVIKLFALLAPHEPRLAKKLIEPFTTLINTTAAMSLLFEVIQACICGLSEYEQVMRLCIGKLRTFIEHPDPNLKYLGLLAMNNIMRVFPKGVAEHRDVVVTCLEDEDVTIRMRALDLLSSMVTKKNLGLIVKKLIEHLNNADGSYKDELLEKVIAVCSRDNYAYITDFEWYIATLLELSHVQGTRHGKLVKDQLLDVCVRVHVIRQFAVENMINVLRDPVLLNSNDSMTEVLYAAAFIVGEYASSAEDFLPSLESLLQPRAAALSATVQSIYMQNVLKLVTKLAAFATNASESDENRQKAAHDLDLAIQLIEGRLPLFTRSVHLEVQERACFLEVLLKLLKEQREAKEESHIGEFFVLTDEPLNPVSNKAQRKVQVPQGLDLDAWIIEPAPEEPPMTFDEPRNDKGEWAEWEEEGKAEYRPIDPEERKRQRDARRRNMASNPHYLGEELGLGDDDEDDDNGAPVQRLSGADLGLEEGALSNKYRKPKRGGAAKTKKVYTVMTTEDMPEGSGGDSDEERRSDPSVKNALSGVDLSNISSNETLPVRQHRVVPIDVKKPDPARPKAVTPSPTKTPTPSPAKSPKDDKASDYMLGALGGAKSPTAPLSRTSSSGSTGSGRGTFQEVGSIESPTGRPAPKKAAPQAAPKAAAPVTTADDKLRTKTLVKDDLLEITYTTKVSPKEANKILVVFNFKTKAAPVYHIELHFADHAVLQPVAKSPIFVVASIQANQNHSFRVMFNAQSCVNPLSVSGQLTYLQMPAQAKSGEQTKKDFTLNLPSSSFILPQSLTREGFVKLLTTVPNLSLNATSITSKSLKAAVADILGLFGVSRVEESADRASMYGKTTMGHHVAVLIKEEGGPNSLAVAIKSNDIALGDSLIKELSAFFKA